jgi:zinc transporter, ZIP family
MNCKMNKQGKLWLRGLLPLILLGIFLWGFFAYGPLGVFEAGAPPVEEIFIDRVIFSPEHVQLKLFNDGPEPVTIAQVLVNDIYWKHTMNPTSRTLEPRESGTIDFAFPWVEGEPLGFILVSKDGVTFEKDVDVAFLTPTFNMTYFKTFVLLGLYVGVIPILLGLLWFPFLKRLHSRWYSFLLALTIGLLVFLGFDTLEEAFELIGAVPHTLNGVGLIVIGFFLAVLTLSAISYKTEHYIQKKGAHYKALMWGYLIALGIGLHNLGEGLAIGSAYSLGEIGLGATLVVGFMLHNVTEGVAIVSPLTRQFQKLDNFYFHLVAMGILAGAPTIIGTLIGGFSYSATFSILFLAIGAGAIFDVAYDIAHHMAHGKWLSIFTVQNVIGFLLGLLVMYFTGFLVA